MDFKKNDELIIDIEDYGYSGEGVGKVNNFPIFINGAIKGEKVKTKIVKVNKNFAFGRLIDVIEPSMYRVDPKCNFYKNCGGCSLQHINYDEQLHFKSERVKNCIENIGKTKDIKVNPIIGMETPFHYRNKVQLPVKMENGKLKIGFYKERTNEIVEINNCLIQNLETENVIDIFKTWAEKYFLGSEFPIRHLMTRVSFSSKEIMMVLVSRQREIPHIDELISELTKIPKMKSIIKNINTNVTNVILGNENFTLWGDDSIVDTIGEYKFNISPMTFFQVNPIQTKLLYQKVKEYCNLSEDETVIDAYCGAGTISLFLSSQCRKVYGIDIVNEAIEDANINKKLNHVENVEFVLGRCEDEIPKLLSSGAKIDMIVLDPPRKGCERSLLEEISHSNINKIVYVSCDPATLSRDIAILKEFGYIAVEATPVDMFPLTSHVESVVLLTRKDA